MKKYLFLLFLSLFLTACKEKTIDESLVENRKGIVYEINQQEPFTGTVISKYDNGQLMLKENYKDGKKNGFKREYEKNGQLSSERNYKGGKLHGTQKYYTSYGQLDVEENYQDGKKNGIEKVYSETGNLWRKENYKDGQRVN